MRDRKPFDFPHIHVIYRATSGGSPCPESVLLFALNAEN
jgi:hypothetical protein